MKSNIRVALVLLALCAAGTAVANSLDLVIAARKQIGVTVNYDGGYQVLDYPGGDVPAERGVCTDVIVRALRSARGLDLQKLVHEDMSAHFRDYPNQQRWGQREPDASSVTIAIRTGAASARSSSPADS